MSLTRVEGGGLLPDYELNPTLTYDYTGSLDNPPVTVGAYFNTKYDDGLVRAHNLVFVGNQRLTSISFTNLEGLVGNSAISISNMPNLTSLSFPVLKFINGNVGGFGTSTLVSLTTLSIPNLVSVGGGFGPSILATLTTLSAPNLVSVGGTFSPNTMASLTTLSVPNLTTVGGSFGPATLNSLTTLSVPSLTTVGGSFNPNTLASLNTLSAPSLTTIGGNFNPSGMNTLTTISIPNIVSIGQILNSGSWAIEIISGTASLTDFQLPTTLKHVGAAGVGVRITSASLNQTSVDNILVRLAALDGTNGTTSFDSRTVTLTGTSATPSATGLAAKATLQARGCTVTHN